MTLEKLIKYLKDNGIDYKEGSNHNLDKGIINLILRGEDGTQYPLFWDIANDSSDTLFELQRWVRKQVALYAEY